MEEHLTDLSWKKLPIHGQLSPLEVMLAVYTPILECLVKHLPTPTKLNLAQTSTYLRRLLLIYPPYYSHFDFRLSAYEAPGFDNYHLGTIYNLDRFISSLPLEKRITSLTLDWTAITGLFLFGTLMNRCQSTLEHLSVRGCRKVSIKHHIVPYLVYQDVVEPYSVSTPVPPRRALESLYVYKARGVRRKPFLIDRKPADGDEPSRYLTTLAEKLGIWTDLGLCPTPKLRCPRRREILRRGKEKYCVPFDKRWRVQDPDASPNNPTLALLSPCELKQRRKWEEKEGLFTCDNCEAQILDRCEACVYQMTCAICRKAICHECAYAVPASPVSPTEAAAAAASISLAMDGQLDPNAVTNPQIQIILANLIHFNLPLPNPHPPALNPVTAPTPIQPLAATNAQEANPVMHFLQPCCDTAAPNTADMLCGTCVTTIQWAHCDCCSKQICVKHELQSCRRCRGGCEKIFCSTGDSSVSTPGCGDTPEGGAGIKSCLTCAKDVCAECRSDSIHAPPASDDGTESEVEEAATEKVSCDCKVCKEHFYCISCWPSKKTKCEPRPKEIIKHRQIDGAKSLYLYLVTFHDLPDVKKWMTGQRIHEDYASTGGLEMLSLFKSQMSKSMDQPPPPPPTPEPFDPAREGEAESHASSSEHTGVEEEDEVLVGEDEWILEKILSKRLSHVDGPSATPTDGAQPQPIYLFKWLGRPRSAATWEPKVGFADRSRERLLMESFDIEGPIVPERRVKGVAETGVVGVHCDLSLTVGGGGGGGGGGNGGDLDVGVDVNPVGFNGEGGGVPVEFI